MGRHTGPIDIGAPDERPRASVGRHTAPVPVQRAVAPQHPTSPRPRVESPLLPPQHRPTVPGLEPYAPLKARGTVAALPATGPVPVLAAPSLHTAPAPVQAAAAGRSRSIGRVVAVVAGLVVAGSVAAQFTAQRSLAEAPVPLATSSTGSGPSDSASSTPTATSSGSSSSTSAPLPADSGTAPSAGSGGATVPFGPLPSAPGAAPSRTPSDSATPANPSEDPTVDPTAPSDGTRPSRSTSPSATPSTSPSAAGPTSAAPTSSPTATRTTDPSPTRDPDPTADPAPTGGDASVVRSLRAAASDAGNSDLTLGAGSWRFDDFRSDLLGVHITGDLVGAGSDRTSIQMNAHSSSRRSSVPKKDWTTNQLSLLKVSGASRISGFTLRGTDQDHLYNGLRISRSTGTRITDVKVVAVPGGDDIPPGETFGINDFHTDGARYSGVEVDGNGIAAAAFGTNSSANTVIQDSWFHDSGHANGATFWQTRDVTVRDTRSTGNYDAGFNFERVSGDVLLDHVTIKGNRLSHLRINSDKGSADYRIVDPVFDGPRLKILMTPKYMGSPNLQKRSDVHVIIGGVDRTDDVVQWVTHF